MNGEKGFSENTKVMIREWEKSSIKDRYEKNVAPLMKEFKFGVLGRHCIILIPNPIVFKGYTKPNGEEKRVMINLAAEGIDFAITIPVEEGVENFIAINID